MWLVQPPKLSVFSNLQHMLHASSVDHLNQISTDTGFWLCIPNKHIRSGDWLHLQHWYFYSWELPAISTAGSSSAGGSLGLLPGFGLLLDPDMAYLQCPAVTGPAMGGASTHHSLQHVHMFGRLHGRSAYHRVSL